MNKNKTNKNLNKYLIYIFVIVILTIALFLMFNFKIFNIKDDDEKFVFYEHFVFVVDDLDDEFFDSIYKKAYDEAILNNIYIEKIGDKLYGNYTVKEKMEIAIASNPNGIILCSNNNSEINNLIKEAVDKNIPVVTILYDSPDSVRQSFVGPNFFDVGKMYGKLILDYYSSENFRICLLLNKSMAECSSNSIYQGICEELNNAKVDYSIKTVEIDDSTDLLIEEKVRKLALDDWENYDFIVSINQKVSSYLYQALVDYDNISKISIIGFWDSETVLNGIKNSNIKASITFDADELAKGAVNAIIDYNQYGYTNYFIPIDIQVITKDNLNQFIDESESSLIDE